MLTRPVTRRRVAEFSHSDERASRQARQPCIWVDADACPVAIKEVLFRAALRLQRPVTLVANHAMKVPASRYVRLLRVSSGFDVADNEILRRAETGDLVVTSDIPLAAELLDKGAEALSPRGERFSKDTIKAKLTMRDFMETMRASGVEMHGGPPPLSQADRKSFADQLDRWIARQR